MTYNRGMDTETLEETTYWDNQQWLDQESDLILDENDRRERWLDEGYCDDCASGHNLFIGCQECGVHSTKRICMHNDCHGTYCITEYE